MLPTTSMHYVRLVLMTALLWSIGVHATPLVIPDFPLFLTSTGVPPNLVMTIDNSGSMTRSWMPEDVSNLANATNLPRFASPSINGLYYNPKLTYQIPTRSDSVSYTTSFTKAWFNGFDTSKGSVDLSSGYKVVLASQPSDSYSNASFIGSALPAYYYLFYSDKPSASKPSNCDGTRTDNDCYIKIVVGSADDIASGDAAAKKQNFANWYSFYRTRAMTVMSGAMISINGVADNSIRFGWQTINGGCTIDPGTSCTGYGTNTVTTIHTATCNVTFTKTIGGSRKRPTTVYTITTNDSTAPCSTIFTDIPDNQTVTVSGVSNPNSSYNTNYTVTSNNVGNIITVSNSFDSLGPLTGVKLSWTETTTGPVSYENRLKTLASTQKSNFYNWLQRINVSGYTPMRSALNRVGAYYMTSGVNGPYAENPTVSLGTERTCRKDFHVLFTDGLWNTDSGYTTPGSNTNPDSSGNTVLGNSNDPATTPPSPTSYSPIAPYKDINVTPGGGSYTNANDLADTAFYYWAIDLRSGLDNKLSPNMIDFSGTTNDQFWNPKNDPATWQHMVNYAIGLGLSQTLVKDCSFSSTTPDPNSTTPGCPVWAGSTYAGGYAGLKNGTLNWPKISTSPTAGDEPDGHVYDLWHMAINSRGKFYSADSPADVVAAFKDVIDTVSSTAASGGGSAVSSNVARTTEAGATAFVARFNADWSGTLQAFALAIDGTLGATAYWEAGSLIPPGNLLSTDTIPGRKNKVFTLGNTNPGSPQELSCTISALKTELDKAKKHNDDGTVTAIVDNLCSQRLAWLRGYTAITSASWNSTTKIVTFNAPNHGLAVGNIVVVKGVTPSAFDGIYTITTVATDSFTAALDTDPGSYISGGTLRYRDFRDRSSVLGDIMNSSTVYAYQDDFGYGGASIAVDGKSSYKTYVAGKANRVVYVGANDGMLHAFNAEVSSAAMGKELFAYVPAAVYGNLSGLTDPAYVKYHKYFVDGTPTLGDAYISGGWKTYLVGGLRGGGKSIYALNVTNPNNLVAGNVWEFTDTDLGLTFGQPQIGAVSNTQWAAIFGNGYNSTAEQAYLYIVNLSTGEQIAKIATDSETSNGLSTPYLFDSNGDGIVEAIYAGDLQGNLWKFEKNTSGQWVLGNGGHPLFTARNGSNQVQAITTQPKAKLLPGKIMVYFGTGRYLEAGDLTNDNVQTFYAIWDDSKSNDTIPRSSLLSQSIISSTVAQGSYTERTVTENQATDTTNRGCYLDLPATTGQPSERVTSSPLIKSFSTPGLETRVIFVTSTPASDPCEKGGTSWLMEVSTSCGRLGGATSPLDINQDQKFDTNDLVTIDGKAGQSVSGIQLKKETGVVTQITWIEGEGTKGIAYKMLPGSSGQVQSVANSSDVVNPGGAPKRISWEQIQ